MAKKRNHGNQRIQTKPSTNPADLSGNTRLGSNAVEASQYVRFALSQLSGRNGHHEFEQLCFQLARRRIYPNVIPATGPVSAGGDQGKDFETYTVGEVMPVGTRSNFFAQASREKVVFACSLEKNVQNKIKSDLKAAADSKEQVGRVVFLTTEDVPVGRRHKLQEFAIDTYGLSLDIYDGHAISEWLVEPELFWIAQQYLSISSDFVLAVPKSNYHWYEDIVSNPIESTNATESDFYKLKDAVRLATSDPVYRSDLPVLLRKLHIFRSHFSARIQRRAFYEEFVAALRGLEDVRGLEEGLEKYIAAVAESSDPTELYDGAIIVAYSIGAKTRGLLNVQMDVIVGWRKSLLARVNELLAEEGISAGRRCSLLSTLGFLELFEWIETPESIPDTTKAVAVWRRMMKELRRAPLFPLERFGKLLSLLAGMIAVGEGFSGLVRDTDKVLAARFGRHKLAEQAFQRAQSYYEAGKTLEAIDELHKARIFSFTEERARDSVQFCIFLSSTYSEVGLHFASKWYGLGAAFAALKVNDDALRARAYRGLTEAASSDHATGASMEFFLTVKAFLVVSSEFSMAGNERTKMFERSRIDFYSLLLTRAASYLDKALYEYLKGTVLRSFGADDIYAESVPRLDDFFRSSGFAGVIAKATAEGILPPFSDAGPTRRVAWQQLSARWFVEWNNDYETAQAAESFCATLQILLEDLRTTELSLLPSDVHLRIDLHDGNLDIKDNSDNEKIQLKIHLPRNALKAGKHEMAVVVQGVAASALNLLSAIPRQEFLKLYEQRVKSGLLDKFSPYAAYDSLFREFYLEQDFNEHYVCSRGVKVELPTFVPETDSGLAGPIGLHPSYSKIKSERAIRNRYEAFRSQLKYTLPRLTQDTTFLATVADLRKQGWKDWHILQAVTNVRLNYILNTPPGSPSLTKLQAASKSVMNRDEQPTDPVVPLERLTVAELRRALTLSQASTLKGLGFEAPQRTPNFSGLNRFLERFNYWTDDIPHSQIFPDQPGDRQN
jgi:hypothetical protein